MNGLDWLIAGILVLSTILAAAQGFFYEVFSLAGTIVGYLLAAWEYPVAANWFLPYMKNEWAANAAGFLLIFIGVVLLAGVAARIVRWAVQGVGLRWVDRLLGAAFGLVRGALVVTVIVMAMASFGPGADSVAKSSFAQYFLVLGRGAATAAPVDFRKKFRDGLKTIDRMRGDSANVRSTSANGTC